MHRHLHSPETKRELVNNTASLNYLRTRPDQEPPTLPKVIEKYPAIAFKTAAEVPEGSKLHGAIAG